GLRRKPKPSWSTSMVPIPRISSPSSATSFRIANMRSWRRIVEAPSTPSSSAISTSSAGALLLSSFKCMCGFPLECHVQEGKFGLGERRPGSTNSDGHFRLVCKIVPHEPRVNSQSAYFASAETDRSERSDYHENDDHR